MKSAIAKVVERGDLDDADMERAMEVMLRGEAAPAQTAALLVALRMKGETTTELAAAARVMRRHAIPVRLKCAAPILDTCGTGGDGSGTFNISTVSAIVVAATGVTVAKHGNRAATSKSGSADVLEALGLDLGWPPERIARCIEQLGIGFMMARVHHPAMKHVAPVRSELPLRTLFNFLGPLCNPAEPTHQLLGVGDVTRLRAMAEVLGQLGAQGAWVVHGHGGLDEVSLSGPTQVAELRDGRVRTFEVAPADFGLEPAGIEALRGDDAAHNAQIARSILAGERGPRRDAVVINAAAALCAAGVEQAPRVAATRVEQALDSGAAQRKLSAWLAFEG